MEFKLEKEEPFREEVIIKRKKLTMRGLKIRGYLSEDYYLMQPEDSIYIMSRRKKIRSTTDIKAEKESVWEMPIKKIAGIEFEMIVPYHLLNFSCYLESGSTLVKLNSFNYYKRFIRKIFPN